jgi:hypothetical protein
VQVFFVPLRSSDNFRAAQHVARDGRLWMDFGSGTWFSGGRPSEVRLNRTVRIEEVKVRREGGALDAEIFAAVVAAWKATL